MQYYTLHFLNTDADKFYATYDILDPYKLSDNPYFCLKCGRQIYAGEWSEPRKIRLSKPLFGDVVVSLSSYLIVSQRFKDLYEKSGLKGIKTFYKLDTVLVSRNAKKQLVPPPYYQIVIEVANATFDSKKTTCLPASYCENRKNLKVTSNGIKRCHLCNPYNYDCVPDLKGYGIKFLDDNLLDIFDFSAHRCHINFSQKFIDWALANNISNFKGKIARTEEYLYAFRSIDEVVKLTEEFRAERLKRGEEY